jgi:murein DD-endopeptidase MepM/ murein hydrolase activator NlpD
MGTYTVSAGDMLSSIAQVHGTTIEELAAANNLDPAALLSVGQVLRVPAAAALYTPSFKIIPDSELVYGPAARGFNAQQAAAAFGGYLTSYREDVEGQSMTGPEVVQLVADRFSVNPRLLLAILEHRSGWVTQPSPADDGYPMGYVRDGYAGLYRQLSWAADQLNLGFYGRSEGGLTSVDIGDSGQTISLALDINHGTAGVQMLYARNPASRYEQWLHDVGPDGLYATFARLFGNPFSYGVEPLWPASITQPPFRAPWPDGETWYFTGGPHGGWASGSAWAALDFSPPGDQLGCYPTDFWVTAVADGLVTRSGNGAVVVDLDGDGFFGTGWAVTYMHIESRDRVPAGTYVKSGDRLGHPSCEGGFSNATHLHIARTFNGRWVAADGPVPFVMSGWVSQGQGVEYNGYLVRGEVVREAYEGRLENNAIVVP